MGKLSYCIATLFALSFRWAIWAFGRHHSRCGLGSWCNCICEGRAESRTAPSLVGLQRGGAAVALGYWSRPAGDGTRFRLSAPFRAPTTLGRRSLRGWVDIGTDRRVRLRRFIRPGSGRNGHATLCTSTPTKRRFRRRLRGQGSPLNSRCYSYT